MNSDLARLVVIEAFHASRVLGGLVPALKESLPEAEYKQYALAIGACLNQISETILEKVYAEVPGLKESVSANIEKFGRAF